MDFGPPILFVVLDGTRKDRLSLYGHSRDTSPRLEEFANDAVIFENAYTPAPWTLPSHTSMFTGYYPSEHGVTNAFSGEPLDIPGIPTIAELLSSEGYRTAGLSNNPWVGELSGLDRGFDLFIEWDLKMSSRPSNWDASNKHRIYSKLHRLLGAASRQPLALIKHRFFSSRLLSIVEEWMTESNTSPPFAFINLMETHSPFYPPRSVFKQLGLEVPSPLESRRLNTAILRDATIGDGIGTENRDRIMEYYDSSIRAQDERLGELFDELRAANIYEESLIVVCADHGKTLGEFSRSEDPPHYLRDININVPLVVKFPEQRESISTAEPFEMINLFDLFQNHVLDPKGFIAELTTDYALVEDFIPHTASDVPDLEQWRSLSDGNVKLVTDEYDREYVLKGEGPDEIVLDNQKGSRRLRSAMEKKINDAIRREAEVKKGDENLESDVEAHLKDLGYLN